MDCSTVAAANHFAAANQALATIAPDTFDDRANALMRVYASLTPPDELIVGNVGVVTRRIAWRKFLKFMDRLLALAILAALAWIVWRISRMIVI